MTEISDEIYSATSVRTYDVCDEIASRVINAPFLTRRKKKEEEEEEVEEVEEEEEEEV